MNHHKQNHHGSRFVTQTSTTEVKDTFPKLFYSKRKEVQGRRGVAEQKGQKTAIVKQMYKPKQHQQHHSYLFFVLKQKTNNMK